MDPPCSMDCNPVVCSRDFSKAVMRMRLRRFIDLLRAPFIYVTLVTFQDEKYARVNLIKERKIYRLLNEQVKIFDNIPDGLIVHKVQDPSKKKLEIKK